MISWRRPASSASLDTVKGSVLPSSSCRGSWVGGLIIVGFNESYSHSLHNCNPQFRIICKCELARAAIAWVGAVDIGRVERSLDRVPGRAADHQDPDRQRRGGRTGP